MSMNLFKDHLDAAAAKVEEKAEEAVETAGEEIPAPPAGWPEPPKDADGNPIKPSCFGGRPPMPPKGERPDFTKGERPEFAKGERPEFAKGERPAFPGGECPNHAEGERPEPPKDADGRPLPPPNGFKPPKGAWPKPEDAEAAKDGE